jgi:hypothetical protein
LPDLRRELRGREICIEWEAAVVAAAWRRKGS